MFMDRKYRRALKVGGMTLKPDHRYTVTKEFTDDSGQVHAVGESWLYRGYNFSSYDSGWTIWISRKKDHDSELRLSELVDAQSDIVSHLKDYLQ